MICNTEPLSRPRFKYLFRDKKEKLREATDLYSRILLEYKWIKLNIKIKTGCCHMGRLREAIGIEGTTNYRKILKLTLKSNNLKFMHILNSISDRSYKWSF